MPKVKEKKTKPKPTQSPTVLQWRENLRLACLDERLDAARTLLESRLEVPDLNEISYHHALRTTVQDTIKEGKNAATQFLFIEYGAKQYLTEGQFEHLLRQAIELGRPDDLWELLEAGDGKALLEAKKGIARRLALLAAFRGERNALHILSRNGVDVHWTNTQGQSLFLHYAAFNPTAKDLKHPEPVKTGRDSVEPTTNPREQGADQIAPHEHLGGDTHAATDEQDADSQSIRKVVEGSNVREIIRWFVDQKVNLNQKDNNERNALHWAAMYGKLELVSALLYFRPDIESPSSRGRTALHLAAASGLVNASAIVDLLVKAGADVKKESDGGWTALHNASQVGDVAIVERLIQSGANVNAKLSSEVTPLHWACTKGHKKVAEHLLATKNIKRHEEDVWGSTPMLRAAQYGHSEIVKMLAPHFDAQRLSRPQEYICKDSKSFRATVTDFKYTETKNKKTRAIYLGDRESSSRKESIYKVLYDESYKARIKQPTVATAGEQNLRWIHLPANNMAWAKTLITKIFIEDKERDVDAYKALEKALTHRHRGPQVHSTFMIPSSTHVRSNQYESVLRHGTSTPDNRHASVPMVNGTPHTPTPAAETFTNYRKSSKQYRQGSLSVRGSGRGHPTRTTSDSVATLLSEESDSTPTLPTLRARRKRGNIALFVSHIVNFLKLTRTH